MNAPEFGDISGSSISRDESLANRTKRQAPNAGLGNRRNASKRTQIDPPSSPSKKRRTKFDVIWRNASRTTLMNRYIVLQGLAKQLINILDHNDSRIRELFALERSGQPMLNYDPSILKTDRTERIMAFVRDLSSLHRVTQNADSNFVDYFDTLLKALYERIHGSSGSMPLAPVDLPILCLPLMGQKEHGNLHALLSSYVLLEEDDATSWEEIESNVYRDSGWYLRFVQLKAMSSLNSDDDVTKGIAKLGEKTSFRIKPRPFSGPLLMSTQQVSAGDAWNAMIVSSFDPLGLMQLVQPDWDMVLSEVRRRSQVIRHSTKYRELIRKKVAKKFLRALRQMKTRDVRREREEKLAMRRQLSTIARAIKRFWMQIGKLVLYKHNRQLEIQQSKVMDRQLDFFVGETEKYSTMLASRLRLSGSSQIAGAKGISMRPEMDPEEIDESDMDGDFHESDLEDSSLEVDDEETLEHMEFDEDVSKTEDELSALNRESELPLEDLIANYNLPRNVMERTGQYLLQKRKGDGVSVSAFSKQEMPPSSPISGSHRDAEQVSASSSSSLRQLDHEDAEFLPVDEISDDEETIQQEEDMAFSQETKQPAAESEIDNLQREAELPLDELLKQYGYTYSGTGSSESGDLSPGRSEEYITSESESMEEDSDNLMDGLHLLVEDEQMTSSASKKGLRLGMSQDVNISDSKNVIGLDQDSDSTGRKSAAMEDEIHREQSIVANVAHLAEQFQPTGYTLLTTKVQIKQPFLLKNSLREYQLVGLNWLVTMYDNHLNGILADEMGLGKTIQTIALLAYLAGERQIWGPHLIIVPNSVMLNWEMELKKWCPAFKILTYFGTVKERKLKRVGWTKPNSFHVCITSYKLALQDHVIFRRKRWRYLILDEAQHIKNFRSQRWQRLLGFSTQRRLLLTGTPLQNNIMELWSLMHFLMPHLFQSHADFQTWFSTPLTSMIEGHEQVNEQLVRRLHAILRPFILRRLKNQVEQQLPNKYEHVIYCRLSQRQRFLYDDFMSRAQTRETLESGNFLGVLNCLMQLRKVCNHPDLFEPRPVVFPFFQLSQVSGALEPTLCLLERFNSLSEVGKMSVKDSSHESSCELSLNFLRNWNFQFIQNEWKYSHRDADSMRVLCQYELSPDTEKDNTKLFLFPKLHKINVRVSGGEIAANGLSSISMRPNSGLCCDDNVKEQDAGAFIDILSTSELSTDDCSGLLTMTKSVLSHRHDQSCRRNMEKRQQLVRRLQNNERRCKMPILYGIDLVQFLTKICKSNECQEKESLATSNWPSHLQSSSLRSLLTLTSTYESRLELKRIVDNFGFVVPSATCGLAPSLEQWRLATGELQTVEMSPETCCDQTSESEPSFSKIIDSIKINRSMRFPESRLIQYDCGKLQTLDVLLRRLYSEEHRVLIFTQMTKILDILEIFLNYHGYRYVRLDGATKIEQRQMLIERFNNDSRIFVFILSTRSGGLGVNLTGADTVVFYDSDWNPAMDAQARDRCHRIGQTRDVHIYRLISEHTIEENILKKANQKRFLTDVVIKGGRFTTDFFQRSDWREILQGKDVTPSESEEVSINAPSVCTEEDSAEANISERTLTTDDEKTGLPGIASGEHHLTVTELDSALAQAEDESDAIALRSARKEMDVDLLEFSEDADGREHEISSGSGSAKTNDDRNVKYMASEIANAQVNVLSVAEDLQKSTREDSSEVVVGATDEDFREFIGALSPIQRYAMKFMELVDPVSDPRLLEVDIDHVQSQWELKQRQLLNKIEHQSLDDSHPIMKKRPLDMPLHSDNVEDVTSVDPDDSHSSISDSQSLSTDSNDDASDIETS